MRAVLQRVRQGEVTVDGQTIGAIGAGWLVFLGFGGNEGPAEVVLLVDKTLKLRAFPDETEPS